MTVRILSLSARSAESVAVTFLLQSGEHREQTVFLLAPSQIADLRLQCGETTQECYDAVSYHARLREAKKKGILLLGYGGCSKQTLCRKLVSKGFSREIAKSAVEELLADGYFDPASDALREAERGVAKGWGKRRIAAALKAKGYSNEETRDTLTALEDAEVDFVALCAEQIRKKVELVPTDLALRQKLIASLERYGYSHAEIREAFRLLSE